MAFRVYQWVHREIRQMGAEMSAIQRLDARNEVVTAYSSHEKVKCVFGDLIHNVPFSEGIAKMAA